MDPTHIKELSINAGVIIVSTTRTEKTDKSRNLIKELFNTVEIDVAKTVIVPDNISKIRAGLLEMLSVANCIILTGGTGITSDDCTIEAVEPLFDKKMEGFGELFRAKSLDDIGTATVLSRATAGIIDKKAVFCIPGSTNAVKLAVSSIIIPEIKHILTHANR